MTAKIVITFVIQLTTFWDENREALVTYIEHVHTGIKGLVLDKSNMQAISSNATIQVEGIDHDIVSGPSGDYFRLLNPGTYTVSVSAEGYEKSSQAVAINGNNNDFNNNKLLSAKVVNFTLERDSSTEWSVLRDFGIQKNLESKYLSNNEITGKS